MRPSARPVRKYSFSLVLCFAACAGAAGEALDAGGGARDAPAATRDRRPRGRTAGRPGARPRGRARRADGGRRAARRRHPGRDRARRRRRRRGPGAARARAALPLQHARHRLGAGAADLLQGPPGRLGLRERRLGRPGRVHGRRPRRLRRRRHDQHLLLSLRRRQGRREGGRGAAALRRARRRPLRHALRGGDLPEREPSPLYNQLFGGQEGNGFFDGTSACRKLGAHPTIDALPATFDFPGNLDNNQVIFPTTTLTVRCKWGSGEMRDVAVSWVRTEGAGRVFYTNFGKIVADLTDPVLGAKHIVPGLAWVLRR